LGRAIIAFATDGVGRGLVLRDVDHRVTTYNTGCTDGCTQGDPLRDNADEHVVLLIS